MKQFINGNHIVFKASRQVIFYGLLLGIWYFLFSLKIWPEYKFPSPGQVFGMLGSGIADGTYGTALLVSFRRLILGYGLSIILGVIMGVVIGKVKLLDETVTGLFVGLQALPSICWLPIATLWFGTSEVAIIFVVVLGSLLAVTLATDTGIKNIPVLYVKAGRNMGAKGMTMFFHVILPAALPSIIGGLKQGWSYAWRSLMAAEMLIVSLGLGELLNTGRQLNDMTQILSVMIIIIVTGIVMEVFVFGSIEKRMTQLGLKTASK